MPLAIDILGQLPKNCCPPPGPRPTVESVVHGLPWAEVRWQVAPRRPRSLDPQHRLKRIPVITTAPAGAPLSLDDIGQFRPLTSTCAEAKLWRSLPAALYPSGLPGQAPVSRSGL